MNDRSFRFLYEKRNLFSFDNDEETISTYIGWGFVENDSERNAGLRGRGRLLILNRKEQRIFIKWIIERIWDFFSHHRSISMFDDLLNRGRGGREQMSDHFWIITWRDYYRIERDPTDAYWWSSTHSKSVDDEFELVEQKFSICSNILLLKHFDRDITRRKSSSTRNERIRKFVRKFVGEEKVFDVVVLCDQ